METEVVVEKIKVKIVYTTEELEMMKVFLDSCIAAKSYLSGFNEEKVMDFIESYNKYLGDVMENLENSL